MQSLKQLFLLIACFCISLFSMAGVIKGKVADAKTGEPLVGAIAEAESGKIKLKANVNLDGSFIFHNVPAGKYEVKIKFIGYKETKGVEVVVKTGKDIEELAEVQMSPDVQELLEVNVVTHDKGSDHAVRNIEKNADAVQNILSEKAIQLLPDVTVANAIQRVSGVTIQRDNTGEGRYAIIRGMDQRYNNTLVNGIKIPSPDDKFRFVPMDIFPSEMLERLEVIKALTPNMEGDAIGGTMNLIMKNAPDHFLFTANASGGYNTLFTSSRPFESFNHSGINKQSPAEIYGNNYSANPTTDFPLGNFHYTNHSTPVNSTLGITIGDRFLQKKLGVILSVSYQNFYKGSNSERLVPDAIPAVYPGPNTLSFSQGYVRQYSTQTNRVGLQNKIDFSINSRNKLTLFNMYLHQNEYETRYTPDSSVGINSGEVNPEWRSRWQIQDIYNATLHGEHLLSNIVKLDWNGVYSIAKSQVPDMATYSFLGNASYDSTGKLVKMDSTVPAGTVVSRSWQHNSDQDLAGYANLTYKPTILHHTVEFEAGGLYRYKTRTNYYNKYDLQAKTSGVPFHTIDSVPLYFKTSSYATGDITAINADSYTSHEKIAAGYIQAKFMVTTRLQVLGGVRVENTQQDYTTVMPLTFSEAYGTIHYTDVLPSVHLKYTLTNKQNLRLSYFKSISRPGFGEIIPYSYPGEQFTEIGNPYLLHVRADNFDLRYELFPGHSDQLLVGAFYKQLQNPIESFVTNLNGPSSLYIQPQNTDKATNLGLEAVFTKFFGMFGVSANYTYTHSQVTTLKGWYGKFQTPTGTQIQNEHLEQTRPLQGQANNVGNLSFLYKNPRIGLDVQLALSYTGDRIAQVSPYYGLDIWQKPYSQLSLSFEKTIAKHFSFYAKLNNLTNAPIKDYIKFPYTVVNGNFPGGYTLPFQDKGSNYTVAQRDIYKANFLGGIRYKF